MYSHVACDVMKGRTLYLLKPSSLIWHLMPYHFLFNPTLNIKMVFGEKKPKMGTFSDFVTFFFFSLLNVITKFNNFPTYLP